MQETIQAGSVFIREGTEMPETLKFESESYSPGWRSVHGIDGYGLDRKVQDTGWHFFYFAGANGVRVFGREGQKTVGSAVKRILASLKSRKINSCEITRVTFKTFMGVPYTNVTFHMRNIQESMLLLGSDASWPR
jgi:hypothetical protein